MAAKLEWSSGDLYLGVFRLGQTRWSSTAGGRNAPGHQWRVGERDWSEPYQDSDDAQQDCEAEVRRMLKEAGVEV